MSNPDVPFAEFTPQGRGSCQDLLVRGTIYADNIVPSPGGVGPGTVQTIPMFDTASSVADSPLIVDTTTAAASITHTSDNFSVGIPGTPDPGGGNPDGSPFYVSLTGHAQINKLDVTSTGAGAIESWGGLSVDGNVEFGNRTSADLTTIVNQLSQGVGTYWRSLDIYDGKGAAIVEFDGPTHVTTLRGPLVEPNADASRTTDLTMATFQNTGSYDTTGGVINAFAVVAQMSATRAAGANGLINTGFYADVFGAQVNYAIHTVRGAIFLGQDFTLPFCYINGTVDVSGGLNCQLDLVVGSSAFGGTAVFTVDHTTGKITQGTGSPEHSIDGGSGDPEGAVTARPGSLWLRTDTGKAYVKNTGTGNTGWQLITSL